MRRRDLRRSGTLAALLSASLVVAGFTSADEPSLDELLGLEPAPAENEINDTPSPAEPEAPNQVTDRVVETLEGPALTESFEFAVAEMTQIADQLEADDTGLPTRRLQQRVLDRLDQLIDAASSAPPPPSGGSGQPQGQGQPRDGDNDQNQPGQSPQGQNAQGNRPGQGQAQTQSDAGGENDGDFSPGSAQDPEAAERSLDEVRREWGALPPRLRDALSDGLDEPYSPVYRDATEAYYRQLAEEAGR